MNEGTYTGQTLRPSSDGPERLPHGARVRIIETFPGMYDAPWCHVVPVKPRRRSAFGVWAVPASAVVR